MKKEINYKQLYQHGEVVRRYHKGTVLHMTDNTLWRKDTRKNAKGTLYAVYVGMGRI